MTTRIWTVIIRRSIRFERCQNRPIDRHATDRLFRHSRVNIHTYSHIHRYTFSFEHTKVDFYRVAITIKRSLLSFCIILYLCCCRQYNLLFVFVCINAVVVLRRHRSHWRFCCSRRRHCCCCSLVFFSLSFVFFCRKDRYPLGKLKLWQRQWT